MGGGVGHMCFEIWIYWRCCVILEEYDDSAWSYVGQQSDAVLSASLAGSCASGGSWTEEGSRGCRKHCPAEKYFAG